MANRSDVALVISSLMLSIAIVAGSWLMGSALDSAASELSEEIAEVASVLKSAPNQVAAAPSPPRRRGRPDPTEKYEVDTAGSPGRGPSNAKIEIVEFSDFQCPFCKRVQPTLDRVIEDYGNDVRVVFKHFPLSIHPEAVKAHAATEAAHKQGKFWAMHDRVFSNPRAVSEEVFIGYATAEGLDVERFKKDLTSSDVRKRVQNDVGQAGSLGVTGTPAFFINGRFLSGAQPYESFKRVIDEELAKQG